MTGNSAGRIMLYCANFGCVAAHSVWGAPAMRSLQSIPGHILLGQEMDERMYRALQDGGWHLTDPAYAPAGPRTRTTPQMLVAMWPTHCESIRTLWNQSNSLFTSPAENRPTHILTATIKFRWSMAIFNELAVVNFHLHRDVAAAPNGPYAVQFVRALVNSIRASGARILGGDANKAVFVMADLLAAQGIEAFLVAQHAEIDPLQPLRTLNDQTVAESVRFDSCGIWIIGPRFVCKPLTWDTRVVLAAMHAFYLEEQDQWRSGPGPSRQRGYSRQGRGFAATTYCGNVVVPRLDPLTLDCVMRVWQAHEVQQLSDKADVWRFVFANMEKPPPPSGPPPRNKMPSNPAVPHCSAPSRLPPGAPGAEDDASATSAPAGSRFRGPSVRPLPGPSSSQAFQVMAPDPSFEGNLTSVGETISHQMQRLGLPRARDTIPASESSHAPAGFAITDRWPVMPLIKEVPAWGEKWDPVGGVWNRTGHCPFMVCIGDGRTRSAAAAAARNVRNAKKNEWKETGVWPWWVDHESEKVYWTPGGPSTGRGFSGYWWRWSRAGYDEEERREADAAWIALYGEAEYQQAIRSTNWVLQLPYPPPTFAPAGSLEELAMQAAAGEPRLWDAHMAKDRAEADIRRDRRQFGFQAAVPERRRR